LSAQCRLLGIPHSSFYYHPVPLPTEELELLGCFDRFHFEHPSFGSRRLGVQFGVSRGKAKRLMRLLHLEATYSFRRRTGLLSSFTGSFGLSESETINGRFIHYSGTFCGNVFFGQITGTFSGVPVTNYYGNS
jgi:hypothetical protein